MKLFATLAAILVTALPSLALAVSCEEIINGGNYAKRGWFTRGPAYVGCALGQGVGSVIGVPVAAVYMPLNAACGEKDCEKLNSPVEDGGEIGGIVLSHVVGFPFFLVEAIFASGDE